jgi:glyoxylase-like metal-dependent hydrolase (beta-lactamase superfamily II)
MLDSLARVCPTLPDETQVLPGHGAQTTIGEERASNPFLAGLVPGSGPGQPAPRATRSTGL